MADLHLRHGRYQDDRGAAPDIVLHRASGFHHAGNERLIARFCTPRAIRDAIAATGWQQGDDPRTLVGKTLHPDRWTIQHLVIEAGSGREVVYARVSMELSEEWKIRAAEAVEMAALTKSGGWSR